MASAAIEQFGDCVLTKQIGGTQRFAMGGHTTLNFLHLTAQRRAGHGSARLCGMNAASSLPTPLRFPSRETTTLKRLAAI